ncbi:MAG: Hsp70 family protein, partial [Beijerinckiaceae bacterium]
KSHLGSQAFRDTRIFGRRFTLEGLIALFLRKLIDEGSIGEDSLSTESTTIVAGRPVVFAGDRPDEALAVQRLTAAFAEAGMVDSRFAYEPLGAAYWYARTLDVPQTVLVADFGGGTSDFSVMRFAKEQGRLSTEALAHDGVGVAGDTFDFRIIDNAIAPQLGKDSRYQSFGKWLAVPRHFFAAFSRWHHLSWLKGARSMADLEDIMLSSDEPEKLAKLKEIIDHDLGLDLYAAVTGAKMRLSEATETEFQFDKLGLRLSARLKRADFERWIADDITAIGDAMQRALASANVTDDAIDAVFLTGGTSYVPAVRRLFTDRFGEERIHIGEAFQSVASGLALIARDQSMANA